MPRYFLETCTPHRSVFFCDIWQHGESRRFRLTRIIDVDHRAYHLDQASFTAQFSPSLFFFDKKRLNLAANAISGSTSTTPLSCAKAPRFIGVDACPCEARRVSRASSPCTSRVVGSIASHNADRLSVFRDRIDEIGTTAALWTVMLELRKRCRAGRHHSTLNKKGIDRTFDGRRTGAGTAIRRALRTARLHPSAVLARRHAHGGLELPRKRAVIGIAASRGDIGDASVARQHGRRRIESHFQ